ncbi:MAG: ABC transporter ATP-binding protein, partial [Oscillospiraceae bacterium]
MEIYSIKDLNFAYPQSQVNALNRLTFTVSEGDFITICGKSGCGKSTLLHHLKTVLTPHGSHSGEILFCGKPLEQYSLREQASQIGFVMQNGDEQIVTDKVWHELAFGLESLGFDNKTIRLRVAEMASFFGIEEWFTQSTTKLSGGQKQIINLASVMVMQPKVLILDEPTSQLDPIAAVEFLQCLKKINNELGTTIIISEHRLEELFPISDKIAVLDKGTVLCEDTPILLADKIRGLPYEIAYLLPTAMKIYRGTSSNLPCPITVKDGRRFLSTLFAASAF